MSATDRQRWDAIYQERQNQPYPSPDPLLFQHTPPGLGRDRALDVAGRLAQNGLWLASHGYVVDVMEISRVALARAQAEAAVRGLRTLNFFQVDLDEVTLEPDTYDFVCVFRYLQRGFFPQIRAAVKHGGRVVYQTFNLGYLALVPEFNRRFLLEIGELAGYFADWNIVYANERTHVSQIVAVKP